MPQGSLTMCTWCSHVSRSPTPLLNGRWSEPIKMSLGELAVKSWEEMILSQNDIEKDKA